MVATVPELEQQETFRKLRDRLVTYVGEVSPFSDSQVRLWPVRRMLCSHDLRLIESVGGYPARLARIALYLNFIRQIRSGVFIARKLALDNLDGETISFSRILSRDWEIATCLLRMYAAAVAAALKFGDAAGLVARASENLPDLLGTRGKLPAFRRAS